MTPGRLKIWNADADEWQYTPGGGSQPVKLIKVTLDYTQFPLDGTEITLFQTTAGDSWVNSWCDRRTAVDFNDSDGIRLMFAEDPPGPDRGVDEWFALDTLGMELADGNNARVADMDLLAQSADQFQDSSVSNTPQIVFQGGPMKCKQFNGLGNGTAGSVDVYFLIVTPTLVLP